MSKISKEQIAEIVEWLRENDIDCSAAKLHRHFADGVALAMLLKKMHPRLVDLHNYPPQNSTRLKLTNWETLNSKVFLKLGLFQKKSALEALAQGNLVAFETFLFNVMQSERGMRDQKDNILCKAKILDQVLTRDDQIVLTMVNKRIDNTIVQVPHQMVLYSVYERVVRDVDSKLSILRDMDERITRLEKCLQKQRDRIEQLMDAEEKMLESQTYSKAGKTLPIVRANRTTSGEDGTPSNAVFDERAHPNNETKLSPSVEVLKPAKSIDTQLSESDVKTLTPGNSAQSTAEKQCKFPIRYRKYLKSLLARYARDKTGGKCSVSSSTSCIDTKAVKSCCLSNATSLHEATASASISMPSLNIDFALKKVQQPPTPPLYYETRKLAAKSAAATQATTKTASTSLNASIGRLTQRNESPLARDAGKAPTTKTTPLGTRTSSKQSTITIAKCPSYTRTAKLATPREDLLHVSPNRAQSMTPRKDLLHASGNRIKPVTPREGLSHASVNRSRAGAKSNTSYTRPVKPVSPRDDLARSATKSNSYVNKSVSPREDLLHASPNRAKSMTPRKDLLHASDNRAKPVLTPRGDLLQASGNPAKPAAKSNSKSLASVKGKFTRVNDRLPIADSGAKVKVVQSVPLENSEKISRPPKPVASSPTAHFPRKPLNTANDQPIKLKK